MATEEAKAIAKELATQLRTAAKFLDELLHDGIDQVVAHGTDDADNAEFAARFVTTVARLRDQVFAGGAYLDGVRAALTGQPPHPAVEKLMPPAKPETTLH